MSSTLASILGRSQRVSAAMGKLMARLRASGSRYAELLNGGDRMMMHPLKAAKTPQAKLEAICSFPGLADEIRKVMLARTAAVAGATGVGLAGHEALFGGEKAAADTRAAITCGHIVDGKYDHAHIHFDKPIEGQPDSGIQFLCNRPHGAGDARIVSVDEIKKLLLARVAATRAANK